MTNIIDIDGAQCQFASDASPCPLEVIHSTRSEYEPSLTHEMRQCRKCGMVLSATVTSRAAEVVPIWAAKKQVDN